MIIYDIKSYGATDNNTFQFHLRGEIILVIWQKEYINEVGYGYKRKPLSV